MRTLPLHPGVWLALLCPALGMGAPATPPPDWPFVRGGSGFSGYRSTTLPVPLKFAWQGTAAPGAPVTLGGTVYTCSPSSTVPLFGTISARGMSTGQPAWAGGGQDILVFGLASRQPAVEANSKGAGFLYIAAEDDLGRAVGEGFDPVTGARLWVSPVRFSDVTAQAGVEVSVPFPSFPAFYGFTWPISTCCGCTLPCTQANFPPHPPRSGYGMVLNSSDGTLAGDYATAPIENGRPVVSGSLAYIIHDQEWWTPNFYGCGGFWYCRWPPNYTPYYNRYQLSGKNPVSFTQITPTAVPADETPSTYLDPFNASAQFFGPGTDHGDVGLATSAHLLSLNGSQLTARDPASTNGALAWTASPTVLADRDRVAAGNGVIVAVNATSHQILKFADSNGALITSAFFAPSVTVTSSVCLTNDAVLFGDARGNLHVFDLGTLLERQQLKVSNVSIIGDIVVVGQEVVVAAVDGTLVKLSGTGSGCDQPSFGYPENGHQGIGPGGVNTLSGNLIFSVQDLSLPFAGMAITFVRTYNSERAKTVTLFGDSQTVSGTPFASVLGPGWTHSYQFEVKPQFDKASGATLFVEERGDGREPAFTLTLTGQILNPPGIFETLSFTTTGSALSETVTGKGAVVRRKTGVTREYDVQGRLLRMADSNGNFLAFTWTPSGAGPRLVSVVAHSTASTDSVAASLGYDAVTGRLTSLTSPHPSGVGTVVTQYQYTPGGLLSDVIGPGGVIYHARYEYDLQNRLNRKRDARGPPGAKRLRYDYDVQGRVSQVRTDGSVLTASYAYATGPAGQAQTLVDQPVQGGVRETIYEYDECRILVRQELASGVEHAYHWDANRLPVVVGDATGRSTTLTYDSRGNVTQVRDAQGGFTTRQYDPLFSRVVHAVNPIGAVTDFARDAAGNPVSTTQFLAAVPALGESAKTIVTNRVFDARGLLTGVLDPNAHEEFYQYDTKGLLTQAVRRLVLTASVFTDLTTQYEYDAIGRRTAQVDPRGVRTEWTYDLENRPVTVRFGVSLSGEVQAQTTYQYDDATNLLTMTTDAAGRFTKNEYDPGQDFLVKVSDAVGTKVEHTYDLAGQLLTTKDGNGHTTAFQYDAAGRLSQVTDAKGGQVLVAYDGAGNITSLTDPNGHTTQYAFDGLNRRVQVTHPDLTEEHFEYDGAGNQTAKVDARNIRTEFLYDSLNRLRQRHTTDPTTADARWFYDNTGNRTKTETEVMTGAGLVPYTVTDAYDSLNRLTDEDIVGLAVKHWDRDANGNPTQLTVDAPMTPATDLDLEYQYDDLNRVTAVTQAGLTTRYAYEAGCASCGGGGGNLVEIARPNGISTTMIYDSASRLMKIRNFNAQTGVALTFDAYTYDSMQNRLSQRDSMGTWSYQYDDLDRLTQASHPVLADQTFQYDPAGNRTSLLDERQGTFTSAFNPTNEIEDLTGTASKTDYTFDPRGVLVGKSVQAAPPAGQPVPSPQVTSYLFDDNERLIQATTPSLTKHFGYDADGQRVVEQVNGRQTWYVFNGLNVLMELDQDKKPTALMNPGVSKTRLDVPSHLTEYFLHDGLGSVVMVTDQLGNPTQMYSFEPFGREQHAPRLDPHNRYRYVGLASDDDLSLTYMNARWYDPFIGRFLSRDPNCVSWVTAGRLISDPQVTQGFAAHVYVRQNAPNRTDRAGMAEDYVDSAGVPIRRIAEEPSSVKNGGDYGPLGPILEWLDKHVFQPLREVPTEPIGEPSPDAKTYPSAGSSLDCGRKAGKCHDSCNLQYPSRDDDEKRGDAEYQRGATDCHASCEDALKRCVKEHPNR